MTVNDTVTGDPLMTVPLYILNLNSIVEVDDSERINLCYEVHGEADTNFNLVSDECVSVNAHYTRLRPTEPQNIINAIYVRAVDNAGICRNIAVDLDGCLASVDDANINIYMQNGVAVRRYNNNRVRIAVPNCQDQALVMWVFCQNGTFYSTMTDESGRSQQFQAEMIRFVIARGFNLQETSHGILGRVFNLVELYIYKSHFPCQANFGMFLLA